MGPNKGHDENFAEPVLGHFISISTGLGVVAAGRPQEKLNWI